MVGISHQFIRLSDRKSKGKRLFYPLQVFVEVAFLQDYSNGCESSHRKKTLQRGGSKLQHKRPTPKDHLSSLRKKRPLSLPLFYGVTKLTHSMSSLTFVRNECFTSVRCRSLFRMTLFFKRSTRVRYHLVFYNA